VTTGQVVTVVVSLLDPNVLRRTVVSTQAKARRYNVRVQRCITITLPFATNQCIGSKLYYFVTEVGYIRAKYLHRVVTRYQAESNLQPYKSNELITMQPKFWPQWDYWPPPRSATLAWWWGLCT